jgi:hypothetical protein
MAKQLYGRLAGAAGLLALAAFFTGIDPFLSLGAGSNVRTPAVSVDRTLKGDRLPLSNPAVSNVPDWQAEFGSSWAAEPRAQMPFACDPAFSPILKAKSANVYRRCMA